jgi:hypothetical protein
MVENECLSLQTTTLFKNGLLMESCKAGGKGNALLMEQCEAGGIEDALLMEQCEAGGIEDALGDVRDQGQKFGDD